MNRTGLGQPLDIVKELIHQLQGSLGYACTQQSFSVKLLPILVCLREILDGSLLQLWNPHLRPRVRRKATRLAIMVHMAVGDEDDVDICHTEAGLAETFLNPPARVGMLRAGVHQDVLISREEIGVHAPHGQLGWDDYHERLEALYHQASKPLAFR